MIDPYLADLSAALHGPRRAKTDLLAEARDSLVDVADAYRLHGMDPDAAERKAVEEFGTVGELAPSFQAELSLTQGRRTASLVVVVLVLQPLLWEYGPQLIGQPLATDPAPGYAWVDVSAKWLGAIAVGLALSVAVGCGIGQRYAGWSDRLTRTAGVLGLGVAAVFTVTGALFMLLSRDSGVVDSLTGVPWLVGMLLLPLSWIALSARRCLALSGNYSTTYGRSSSADVCNGSCIGSDE